jgi:ABC-type transporter Mla MlaB component
MGPNANTIALDFDAQNHWKLIGAINFYNVAPILLKGEQQLKALVGNHTQATIDFSGVTRCDSAAVAMMLRWMHLASHCQVTLNCVHLPEQVLAIIKMANLNRILTNSVTVNTLV